MTYFLSSFGYHVALTTISISFFQMCQKIAIIELYNYAISFTSRSYLQSKNKTNHYDFMKNVTILNRPSSAFSSIYWYLLVFLSPNIIIVFKKFGRISVFQIATCSSSAKIHAFFAIFYNINWINQLKPIRNQFIKKQLQNIFNICALSSVS